LAPYGRDETRAYAYKASQIDIVEAVEAASAAYPIDEGRLIIGGFSMGGYGALRAFYENPSLYKGVAVLAGHPNLASEWLGEPHPNFLMAEDLLSFKGVPVFIYHGRKDPSLPVTLAEKLAERLTEAGAEVTLHIDDEAAHVYPNPRIYAQFQAWLREVADE
jgi:predicted esterase